MPESYCSYHKLLLGLAESGVMPAPLCVLNTSLACDANQLTFRRLAQHYQVPRFTVDVPLADSPADLAYVAGQLREMGAFLEQCSGKKLDVGKLRQALAYSAAHRRGLPAVPAPAGHPQPAGGDERRDVLHAGSPHAAGYPSGRPARRPAAAGDRPPARETGGPAHPVDAHPPPLAELHARNTVPERAGAR